MTHFDYLAIGHITKDRTATGYAVGGTVAYAGQTAQALGCRTAVLTSAGPDFDVASALPGITIEKVAGNKTTTFENHYDASGRQQRILHTAAALTPDDVPAGWERASIVHLAPVAGELDPALIGLFTNSLVGLTPQGWLRDWDENGWVIPRAWARAQAMLPLAAAVIISEEDMPDPAMVESYRQWTRLLVVTRGSAGCTVFLGEERGDFPAPVVTARNLTGAGDIFAAAFLVRLYQTRGNPWEAADFANKLAAHSVTEPDLPRKIAGLQGARG